ncbi:oligopeptide ABC transporter permease OppC [Marinomonas pollencensis]|uniref:Oligopeptide transport system permease protein OppC n=1 Tax=Marinomonas pollencensis TaxID=491954 RepID=A0A3E0DR51_9GAMM|nr:oligopeptide ABC transporter permease OppC [Marinomonas pollencensis]REG83912.1 oligopeptide transport system permease protein [Marinomonas pollencensis]
MITSKDKVAAVEQFAEQVTEIEGRSLWQDARRRFFTNKAAVISLIILALIASLSIFGPLLSQWNYADIDWAALSDISTLGRPSIETGHYFGTDPLGRDIFVRTMQGGQISLMVGILGSFVAIVIGTLYGATSGYLGGRVDSVMMRILEILNSFPFMFFVIILMTVFGRNILLIFIAIGAVSWLDMARIVRGQTLSLKNKEYIEAAYACGVSSHKIILRHIVPNVLGVVIVYATLLVPNMILLESFISFLGLGVQEPMTSWGALISEGSPNMEIAVWQLAWPLAFLVVTLFCFNFLGDGLRDALDPKDR